MLVFRLPVFSQYPRMHRSDRMRENTNQKKTPYSDTFYLVCIFYTAYDIYRNSQFLFSLLQIDGTQLASVHIVLVAVDQINMECILMWLHLGAGLSSI